MSPFSNIIINWYQKNKRDLPWRNTKNPYFIWLSEIILQQTRVNQGIDYYHKFINEFPTIKHLADADNQKIMKLWQGLGYYSRARNLHETSKIIINQYNGIFPNKYEDIITLKGIGDYTAAAIASFAFNKCHAVVDGNVYRVLARVFGIPTPIDTTKGKNEFKTLANELINKQNPALHNQAIMEFGAMYCKPVNPDCPNCPLIGICYAHSKQTVKTFPVKSKKIKVRKRYFNYIILHNNKNIILKKRTENDIWKNLYDFPLIETEENIEEEDFLNSKEWKSFIKNNKYTVKQVSHTYQHILSHQKIHARFWEIRCDKISKTTIPPSFIFILKKNINNYPIPRLIEKYFTTNKAQF